MAGRGRLIAIEGIDGSGKSTQARRLAEHLGAQLTREPGDNSIGASVRQLLLWSEGSGPSDRAEALLVAADRAQHVAEVLSPAVAQGRWVVTERYSASTLAYQGYGRGLDLDVLSGLVDWATAGLSADLTVLIDLPVAVAQARRADTAADRVERLDEQFHERVRAGYLAMAGAAPGQWVVIDGSGTVDEVEASTRRAVSERLGAAPSPPT